MFYQQRLHFLQAAISDTETEYKNYLKVGVMNIIAEIIGIVIPEAITYSVKETIKGINLYSRYKFNKKFFT
ncbi:MAG: hypothetical protein AB8V21_10655 [Arsenophonus endosymbiont of Dermacentor nuttalli]